MEAYHPGTGMRLEFPDGTPDWQIQQHFQNAQASMAPQAAGVAQQYLTGLRQQYAQQQAAPPPINGRGFVGLDPQQAQFMLQQRQYEQAQSQQNAVQQQQLRLQEQKQNEDSLNSEKDRALQIKLYNARLQNDAAVAQAEAKREEIKQKLALKGKKLENRHDTELEALKHENRLSEIDRRNEGTLDVAKLRAQNRPAAQANLQRGEGVDENGNPVFFSFDPRTGTAQPIRGVAPAKDKSGSYKGFGISFRDYQGALSDLVREKTDVQSNSYGPKDPEFRSAEQIRKAARQELDAQLATDAGYDVWVDPSTGEPYWADPNSE